ncbi:MAG: zf-HC2 domain-containing protein, partial [Phycisphaerae bacterium]|nr:zf-HC2 domain-containing protein [Phycisphaerae bacterium]
MNAPCQAMQDRIADHVLRLLDPTQADALPQHMHSCPGCRG